MGSYIEPNGIANNVRQHVVETYNLISFAKLEIYRDKIFNIERNIRNQSRSFSVEVNKNLFLESQCLQDLHYNDCMTLSNIPCNVSL